jgi:hypothetical protein
MALETRPLPVLKGKMAEEFFKRAAECKVSETREEIQALLRWAKESGEEAREREEREEREAREAREREEAKND